MSWNRPLATLALLGALLLASVPAAGHAVTTPLPVEYEIFADEGEDAYFVVDGYDLYDLFVREAYVPGHGDGLVFRFSLWGGFAPEGSTADTLSVLVGVQTATGPVVLTASTSDPTGAEWESRDAVVLRSDAEPDLTGNNVMMELFAPQETFGVQVGDTVSGIWMESFVDDDVIDIAPGGLVFAGTEVPTESFRFTDQIELKGPVGYTQTTGAPTGDETFSLTIQNPFATQGQHVHVEIANDTTWAVDFLGPQGYAVAENKSVGVELRVNRTGTAPLALYVLSDLGGRETLYLTRSNGTWAIGPEPGPMDLLEVVDEAPAPGLWLAVLVGLALLAARRGSPLRRS